MKGACLLCLNMEGRTLDMRWRELVDSHMWILVMLLFPQLTVQSREP